MVSVMKRHTVNTTITILVSLADHLVNLIIGQLFANGSHHVAQLGGRDKAVVVAIEHLRLRSVSPALLTTCLDWGISFTLKASRISSSESVSFILRAIMVKNSVTC